MESLKEKRESYRNIAYKVLQDSENSRNSDWSFLFNFLMENNIAIPWEIRNKIHKSGLNLRTIMRERQYIQNTEGLFPPTDPLIIQRRKNLQQQYTQEYKKQ